MTDRLFSTTTTPRQASRALHVLTLGLALPGLASLAGCYRNDPDQVTLVQTIAKDLRRPKATKLTAVCSRAVPELRNEMDCDALVMPLFHYAPDFAGSTVERRGASSLFGGMFGKPALVPLRWKNGSASGNIDVLMRRTGTDWNIAAILPTK